MERDAGVLLGIAVEEEKRRKAGGGRGRWVKYKSGAAALPSRSRALNLVGRLERSLATSRWVAWR